jgi:hypothetical protein
MIRGRLVVVHIALSRRHDLWAEVNKQLTAPLVDTYVDVVPVERKSVFHSRHHYCRLSMHDPGLQEALVRQNSSKCR